MTGIALTIVLVSAALHACWNYLAKKSQTKIVFIWWFLLVSTVIYFPMAVVYWPTASISATGWWFVLATGVLHFLYFYFLGGAYERGDLSLVYPLSRGAAPIIVPLLAVIFINETISLIGGIGIGLVAIGIYVIHLKSFSPQAVFQPLAAMRGTASVWAGLTGATIAAYALVDKIGVTLVYPPIYIYLMQIITWLLLSPFVLINHGGRIADEWHVNRWPIILVAMLVTASYLLILFALQLANVSYVITAREISIVFSVLFGLVQLKEKHGRQKMTGAVLITMGVICLGVTR